MTIYERAKRIYFRLRHPDMSATFESALDGIPDAFLVQVGANDGDQGDPIRPLVGRHPGWRGLLIEPVPFVFARLRQNYQDDPRFLYEQIAIADSAGEFPFYHVTPEARTALGEDVGRWADAVSSFDRDHLLRCDPRLDPFIVEERIACARLDDVLAKRRITRIDAVCIDTEGADEMVLAQVDLQRFRPRVVLYEHKHLSHAGRRRARERLAAAGYRLRRYDYDTLAVREG